MSLKISLKRITMNDIAVYLPILVLNFNLYGIACTVGTPRLKDLFFVWKEFARPYSARSASGCS